jgi:hypothetical protein
MPRRRVSAAAGSPADLRAVGTGAGPCQAVRPAEFGIRAVILPVFLL